IEDRKQRLGFGMALKRSTLHPQQALDAADWNARAFQIAPPDPVFGLGDAGTGGAGEQRESPCCLVPFGQATSASQRRRWQERADHAIEESQPSGMSAPPHGSRIPCDATGKIRPSR